MHAHGFWLFLCIMNALIPLTMVGVGFFFAKGAPVGINPLIGYRTARSMKNRDTWEFAHRHCGRIWRRLGWAMLALTAITTAFLYNRSEDEIGMIGTIVCAVQVAALVASIFPTELALRRTFNKDGMRF